MTIAEMLAEAARSGMERLDAQLLVLHALGRPEHDRAWLFAHDDEVLPAPTQQAFAALCRRRLAGEPVAYLTGTREFFGLALQVDARVLVPRPDTETLVSWALELLAPDSRARVVDLGTGSGAIALAIKNERPLASVEAVDASAGALEVATANAQRLRLDVVFHAGNWFSPLAGRFDLVVSNPPYIAAGDAHLPALAAEPAGALVAGPDGLSDLRLIVAGAPAHLKPGGWLLLEHGWDQAEAVRALLEAAGFIEITSRRDIGGNARCSGGKLPELG